MSRKLFPVLVFTCAAHRCVSTSSGKKSVSVSTPGLPCSQEIRHISFFEGAQYDWTAGGPYNGNEWRKCRVVPHTHPWRPLFYACYHGSGSKGAFRLPGVMWDRFRCTVEPSPGHIRCRFFWGPKMGRFG